MKIIFRGRPVPGKRWLWASRPAKPLRFLLPLVLLLLLGALVLQPMPGRTSPLAPLRSVSTTKRELALTFDISWGETMPSKVLAVLEKYRVPATFFLSGPWAKTHPDVVRRIARDGFQVESHGQRHVDFSGLSAAGVADNITQAGDILKSLTGKQPTFIRPPNGDYNQQSLRVAAGLGYTTVIWGSDSLDWMNPGVDVIIRRVLTKAHPGDVVLLHASDTCQQTDIALPAIIEGLRQDGYQLVTLRKLLNHATAGL